MDINYTPDAAKRAIVLQQKSITKLKQKVLSLNAKNRRLAQKVEEKKQIIIDLKISQKPKVEEFVEIPRKKKVIHINLR